MKIIWIILISSTSISFSTIEHSKWDQYLGNPGRTAFIDCDGPDPPEISWKIELPGDFGNSVHIKWTANRTL